MTPELENNCGSWVIIKRSTGKAVLETFSKKVADAIDTKKYEVLTTLNYLVELNRRVAAGNYLRDT